MKQCRSRFQGAEGDSNQGEAFVGLSERNVDGEKHQSNKSVVLAMSKTLRNVNPKRVLLWSNVNQPTTLVGNEYPVNNGISATPRFLLKTRAATRCSNSTDSIESLPVRICCVAHAEIVAPLAARVIPTCGQSARTSSLLLVF